ncbi:MAG: hypothetical protein ACSLFA_18550 [Mycobacterium sp.]
MFERAKFMVEFAGTYRRARRAGVDHEAALLAATDGMFERRRSALPASIGALWRDPAGPCALADGGWFGDGSLAITDAHLVLLRQARLGWDAAERGAPMLDPQRPYGREDLLTQLGEVFGARDVDVLARHHVDMYFVIARALKHGTLAPGRYPLGSIDAAEVRGLLRGYGDLSDEEVGLDDDGQVLVTEDHLQLLRAIEIRWPSEYDCGDRLDAGRYPAAAADAKRPYGDYTFIEVDMARILGELPPVSGSAVFEPGPELADRLQRLHWQMLATMQVFLEHMELVRGTYGLHPDTA